MDESAKGSNRECGERRVEDRPLGKVHNYRKIGEERAKKPEEECSGRMKRTQRGNTV